MRTFIALELPQAVKKELTNCQRELEKTWVQARWVKPDLSHLTLAFLGSITPEKKEKIEALLENTTKQVKPFSLHLQKINGFPNLTNPRIIFIDLGGEIEKLNLLTNLIRQGLKKENLFFDQKPFVSHITLGRLKKKQNLKKIISQIKPEKGKFTADKVSLKQSTLTSSGSIYRTLKSLSL
ncbi:MAG: RNA 2',3'-cyclic phosphodiesterase [Candidatus Marinimicrobia bacterium]|nr:RNA 2',3'-cyclic phosphodiesterase [Candidatus Neomarinimicrobiota bacterium]